jgi:diguanylate cyclase (GGDEF)-like protein
MCLWGKWVLTNVLVVDDEGKRVVTNVLVVDDEEIICTLFAAMLSHYGNYHVVTTTDGRQVMDILRREPFDVMLLDMSMPAISGLDVLRQVTQAFEELPIIIVTGHGSIEVAVESMQAGAADFVTKPVPAAVLHLRIQKALEHARTRRLASTDGLTEVYNHRTFQERLTQEIARANRYNRPLSVLMIDVDHFKVYNDTYGHPGGDLVLQDLARLLQGMSRTSDTVARYGGEEFAVILPETDSVSAQKIGQRLREQVEGYPFSGKELMPGGTITISVGVATHVPAGSKDALLQAADMALYTAKHEGRNRVCVAE